MDDERYHKVSSRGQRRYQQRHSNSTQKFRGSGNRADFTFTNSGRGRNSYPPTKNYNRNQQREVHFENASLPPSRIPVSRTRRPNNIRPKISSSRQPTDPENQWFRVEIPYGESSGKEFLFRSLNGLLEHPVIPYNYHTEGTTVVFYTIGIDTAEALRSLNLRITKPDGFKIKITLRPSTAPQSDIDDDLLQMIRDVMSKRFNLDLNYLDLSNFRKDETFTAKELYVSLDRPAILKEVVKIIQENIPNLTILNMASNRLKFLEPLSTLKTFCKSFKAINLSDNMLSNLTELDSLKGMNLEEIWVKGNPCVENMRDRTSLIRTMRSLFPKIVKLDGEDLPVAIGFDVGEEKTIMPATRESYIPEVTKSLVHDFLKAFYNIYDTDDRQQLVAAYHDQASFSFSISKAPDQKFPPDMMQESRNLLRVRDVSQRTKLLKIGKINIVAALNGLPTTQHLRESFLVDIPIYSEQLIVLVVNGLLLETGTRVKQGLWRSFCRTFTIIPQGGGFVITNDLLLIANSSHEQREKYRSPIQDTEVMRDASIRGDAPNALALEVLITRLHQQTGMNEAFSRQCLTENDFDYEKALKMFNDLNSKGGVPPAAFS